MEKDTKSLTKLETNSNDNKIDLAKRIDKAFNIALGKFLDSNGKIETVMQTGEAFGRGLFADIISEKPKEWTMKQWIDETVENIISPIGNDFSFIEISEDKAISVMNKSVLHEKSDETIIASLFTYGFIRGLLKSAFPKGELVLQDQFSRDLTNTTFIFKTKSYSRDKFERERVKNVLSKQKS